MLNHILNWLISPETFILVLTLIYPTLKLFKYKSRSDIDYFFDQLIGIAISEVKKQVEIDKPKKEKQEAVIEFLKSENKKKNGLLKDYDLIHLADIAYNTYVKPSLAQ